MCDVLRGKRLYVFDVFCTRFFVPREVQVVAQVAEDRGWRVVKSEEKASGVACCSSVACCLAFQPTVVV